jgi:hypothetical protein
MPAPSLRPFVSCDAEANEGAAGGACELLNTDCDWEIDNDAGSAGSRHEPDCCAGDCIRGGCRGASSLTSTGMPTSSMEVEAITSPVTIMRSR